MLFTSKNLLIFALLATALSVAGCATEDDGVLPWATPAINEGTYQVPGRMLQGQ